MNPNSTQRLRRLAAVAAIAWAMLALGLEARSLIGAAARARMPFACAGTGLDCTLQAIGPEARAAGVEAGDRLVSVDGVPVSQWLRGSADGLVPGRSNRYELVRRGAPARIVELAPKTSRPRRDALVVAIPLMGATYLGIGLLAWWLRPGTRESWAFLLFCCGVAAELAISRRTEVPMGSFGWGVARMATPLMGATAFHLFTTYPFEPAWALRRPQLRPAVYAAAFALMAGLLVEPWFSFGAEAVATLSFFFPIVIGLGCLAALLWEWRTRRGDPVRDRASLILLAAMLSFLPPLTALLAQYFLGVPFPWRATLLGLFVFPAAVGWSLVRTELVDVRGAARSSAAYGVVTLGITGVFALAVTFADALFARFNVNARSPVFSLVFLFLAILLVNPLRSRLQRFVDSAFDRDRAAYRRAVREISEAMVSMLSVREIADRILVAVTDTMGVEGALVLLPEEDDATLTVEALRGDWDDEARIFSLPEDHPVRARLWMRREELTRFDFDGEKDAEVREAGRDVFDALGVELLVPILFGVELLGVIGVGRKLSGERLAADDRQLLRTLANQSAIAIENARAFDEIGQLNETLEARVEERTRELRRTQAQLLQSEKMRSLGQLVAGVAHELNNPIGFVHANLQLIQEYSERLERTDLDAGERARLREALAKLLERSREGTERVKKIVQDLRTFSRADTAELEDADLNREIERTLGLMESRLGHGIEVEPDFGELPPVRCFPGQLNQVFMNLLINACDALEGKGRIRIRTRPSETGVRLEFTDDGPGIRPEVQGRIFEPFYTSKPVGQGTGLGLSLSHGIVEGHGGTLTVRSEPGEGASFVVELPLRPPGAPPGPAAPGTPDRVPSPGASHEDS